MKLLQEFKAFALKGNILDLAVAVVIGGAFGKIVASFVNDILMPPIGVLLGNVDFKDLKIVLKAKQEAVMNGTEVVQKAINEVTLNYGSFIQNIIDFLIIAMSVFLIIKVYNTLERKKVEEPVAPAPPPPTPTEALLTEIRDLLKK
jgi:large conductance mechanosensitive channel